MKITRQTPGLGIGWSQTYGQTPEGPSFEGTAKEIEEARAEARNSILPLSEHLFVDRKLILYPSPGQVLWSLWNSGEIDVRLEGEPAFMAALYTNREQCVYFAVPYFGAGELKVAADALLFSRPGGYDEQHTEFLTSLGSDLLYLSRGDPDTIGPGWWHVNKE